jgi:serine/threonine-protein kinase
VLRRALGTDILRSRGDEEIGLNFGELWSDALAFEQALDEAAHEQALALYGGDLLSGFHLPEAAEFDSWLDAERTRLRRRAQEAARELARKAESEGDDGRASGWLHRALSLYPNDEVDLQALVRLLNRAGDRAGALREYQSFAKRLAVDLEIEPSPESRALIEEIRSRITPPTRRASTAPSPGESPPWELNDRSGTPSRSKWLVLGGAGALVVVSLMAGLLGLDRRTSSNDPAKEVVAVLPFRVSGADPFLGFLREGMVDLLASKLSGTDHLRTVDPRTLLTWWEREGGAERHDLDRAQALSLARRLGAGRLLEGAVTGTARQLSLSATLIDVEDGNEIRANVEAPYDSLSASIDRLAAELLALEAGEPGHRLAALTSTSLPALRQYLEGRSALRRAAYADAVRHFDRALELDSTFALAGLGRTNAAIWIGEGNLGVGSLTAWPYRERLSARDRATLRFMLGPNYPYRSTNREWLGAAEELTKTSPDDPQAWATAADQLFHSGGLLGMTDALERADRAYNRALALDSTYLPSWEHLAWIAVLKGDSNKARQVIRLRLGYDSLSPLAKEDHWVGLRVLGDTTLPPLPLDHDSLVSQPNGVAWKAVTTGAGLADADTVLQLTIDRVQGQTDRRRAEVRARNFYLIRGWPNRARDAVQATLSTPDARKDPLILEAIYANGDTTLARRILRKVPSDYTRPTSDEEFQKIILQCVAAQFELARGNPEPARSAVRAWLVKPMKPESLVTIFTADYAARLLDAQLAALDRRPDARARLEELDSLLASGPTGGDFFERIGNIESARLWHDLGEPARALASIRRRLEGLQTYSELPRYLRDEGRYAALVGDSVGAVQAYRHYLTLRSRAEPSLQPQVDTVRAELAALQTQ